MLFDILHLNGRSLIKEPYEERRRILEDLIPSRRGSRIQVPPIFDGDLQAAVDTSRALKLEGVVAKKRYVDLPAGAAGPDLAQDQDRAPNRRS